MANEGPIPIMIRIDPRCFRIPTVAVVLAFCGALFFPGMSFGACLNKYVFRSEPARQNITLLTGHLTFQEAQDLSKAIAERKHSPIEWVDEQGKTVAKQFGELKVVRPMPVGCGGKASGVVVTVIFTLARAPSQNIWIRLDEQTVVEFEQQKQ